MRKRLDSPRAADDLEQTRNTADGSPLVSRAARVLNRLRHLAQRTLLRWLLTEHAPDDARQQLAERVVKHLETAGFELDEDGQALRKRPPLPPHGMPRGE